MAQSQASLATLCCATWVPDLQQGTMCCSWDEPGQTGSMLHCIDPGLAARTVCCWEGLGQAGLALLCAVWFPVTRPGPTWCSMEPAWLILDHPACDMQFPAAWLGPQDAAGASQEPQKLGHDGWHHAILYSPGHIAGNCILPEPAQPSPDPTVPGCMARTAEFSRIQPSPILMVPAASCGPGHATGNHMQLGWARLAPAVHGSQLHVQDS